MPDPNPTVGELFKARVVTHDDLNTLIDAVLDGRMKERAELAEGYTFDVAAAVKANAFATAVLRDSGWRRRVQRWTRSAGRWACPSRLVSCCKKQFVGMGVPEIRRL